MDNSFISDKLRKKIEDAEEFYTHTFQEKVKRFSPDWEKNPRAFFNLVVEVINGKVLARVLENPLLLADICSEREFERITQGKSPSSLTPAELRQRIEGQVWLSGQTLERAWKEADGFRKQDKKLNVLLVFLRVDPDNWEIYKKTDRGYRREMAAKTSEEEQSARTGYYACFIAYKNRINRARISLDFGSHKVRIAYWRQNPDSPASQELRGTFSVEERILRIQLYRDHLPEGYIHACLDDGDLHSSRAIAGVYVGLDFQTRLPISGGIWLRRVDVPTDQFHDIPYPQEVPTKAAWHLINSYREFSAGPAFPQAQKDGLSRYAGAYSLYHVADVAGNASLQRSVFVVNPDFSTELRSVSGFRYVGDAQFMNPLGDVMVLRFTSLQGAQHSFQVVLQRLEGPSEYLWGVYSGLDQKLAPEAGRAVAFLEMKVDDPDFHDFLQTREQGIAKIPIGHPDFSALMSRHPAFLDFFSGKRDDFIESDRLFRVHLNSHVEENVLRKLPVGHFDLYTLAQPDQIRRYRLQIDPDGQALVWEEFEHKGFCHIRTGCLEFVLYEQNGERSFNQLIFYIGSGDPRQVQSMVGLLLALSDDGFPMARKSVLIRCSAAEETSAAIESLPIRIEAGSDAFTQLNEQYRGLGDYLISGDGLLTTPREVNLGFHKPFPHQ